MACASTCRARTRCCRDITTLGFATVETPPEGRWRVFGVQAMTRVIQVAQPLSVRERRAAELALQTLKPFALLLPVLALLIWFAVGLALEPLQRLTAQVKARRVDALDALPAERLPDEVQPLVLALNDLLGRLRAALGRERAFMADAAHELRTPLTALSPATGHAGARQRRSRARSRDGHARGGSTTRHSPHRADAGARAPAAARAEPAAAGAPR